MATLLCSDHPRRLGDLDVVFQRVVPDTAERQCRYTDMLSSEQVGTPDYFISHRWGDSFRRVVSEASNYALRCGADPASVRVWLDVFAINQHPGQQQADDLGQLEAAVTAAKSGTILVVDRGGLVLTRIWCLFEIHKTIHLRASEADLIALLPSELDFDALAKIWRELDVAKAEATKAEDVKRILADIEQSAVKSHQLNHAIKRAVVRSSQLQVDQLRSKADSDESRRTLASKLIQCGRMLRMAGNLESALPLLREAEQLHQQLGTQGADLALCFIELGLLLKTMGKHHEALGYYEKSLDIYRKVHGEEHQEIAAAYNNLGELLQAMGKLQDAVGDKEKALAIRRKVLGEEHPETAQSYNNMGLLLQAMGKLDEARCCYEKGLAIRRKVLGEEHPDTAVGYSNMGILLQAMGKMEEARGCYEKGLAVKRKVLGEEHPETAISYNNMGMLLKAMGKLQEALPHYEKSLAVKRRVLGEVHPSTATGYYNLGNLLRALGRLPEALECFEKELNIFRKRNGEADPGTRARYQNMGELLKAMGKTEEADRCFAAARLPTGH